MPRPKPRYSGIPQPDQTLAGLQRTVEALRITVETLTRQRGDENSWPLLVSEARDLGLIPLSQKLPQAPEGKS